MRASSNNTEGVCSADTEYDLEVCRDENGAEGVAAEVQLIDGTTDECEDGEQRIAMYLSTYSTAEGSGANANGFLPPTGEDDADHGFKLNGAFVVDGETQGTFVADGEDAVEPNGDRCDHQPPVFSFE